MPLRFGYEPETSKWRVSVDGSGKVIATAAKIAVRLTGLLARTNGRRNIASAGFTKRWQQGLNFTMKDTDPGAFATARIFHTMPFAAIFEQGGTIRGKPKLWLPIEANLPSGGRWTPREYVRRFGPLVSVNHPGKPPMLFAKSVAKGQVRKPLFVGVDQVTIRKRFDVAGSVARAVGRMPKFYDDNVKADP